MTIQCPISWTKSRTTKPDGGSPAQVPQGGVGPHADQHAHAREPDLAEGCQDFELAQEKHSRTQKREQASHTAVPSARVRATAAWPVHGRPAIRMVDQV